MRRNLAAYSSSQVFLNYPFDVAFAPLAEAMAFGVIAGGLLPVCALDFTTPDRPRLDMLVHAICNCQYSAHDFSRFTGEGTKNYARMNMPIEMGMALFHALQTQRQEHRCAFFVPTPHAYTEFASDLAGLDPKIHNNDPARLLADMYEWLRSVVPRNLFNSRPTVEVVGKFDEFVVRLSTVDGSSDAGKPSHDETRELMYQICSEAGWWDWRDTRHGRDEFPEIPLAFRSATVMTRPNST